MKITAGKYIAWTLCLFLSRGDGFAQVPRPGSNLLTYKDSLYFSELNIIRNRSYDPQSRRTLHQEIAYNAPGVRDEERSYVLELTFFNWNAARAKKTLDLETDHAIVQGSYGIYSVWLSGRDNKVKVTGQIEILSARRRRVTIRENIQIRDTLNQQIQTFIGTRTFKRKIGW